jgi:hypothetical protein
MRNVPLKAFCKKSPMKTGDVDTTFADQVFNGNKVDTWLRENNKHASNETELRGKVNTSDKGGNSDFNNMPTDNLI